MTESAFVTAGRSSLESVPYRRPAGGAPPAEQSLSRAEARPRDPLRNRGNQAVTRTTPRISGWMEQS